MTHEQLQAIKARAEAATPGPWHLAITGDDDPERANIEAGAIDVADDVANDDAQFIAHARTDVPALVAEVERLRRFVKGALIALPHVVGTALLNDCGIEYAENTTGIAHPLTAKPTMK